jgi:predicted ATPase/class 3 adenylate cyclase
MSPMRSPAHRSPVLPPTVRTYLFTDIEGSTRLWEDAPDAMRGALADHDALAREAVSAHRGTRVKATGDGIHAVFGDPLDALHAAIALQRGLPALEARHGLPLRVRCGLHLGVDEARDDDFFGGAVNRAARIMAAAHGGQVLLSRAMAECLAGRLPEGVALRDLGTVHLRGLARAERVHQVVHPGLRAEFPPLRGQSSAPHNLPHALTAFIGRERELAEVTDKLRQSRLVTLVGMGGIGKTRLSLEVAAGVLADFPDGAWLVELAPLHDPALVAQAIASVLKVKEAPGESTADALAAHVCDRTLLLVLDNCEHVAAACASLAAALLRAGPALRILATSREPLRVAGEACCAVPPLPVPSAGDEAAMPALTRHDAVRLFLERVHAAQPRFALDAGNARDVATICRRLDGIPLALELAAARTRSLSVQDIARRLDDRFALLRGGDRTALPRQQTLRALIDWSHDLLDEPERALLRRLAVFAGGFTLDAAEAVCAGASLRREEVLDTLSRLCEKSLVEHDAAMRRYRLLETVREYAQERLVAASGYDAVADAHLAWFVALAEQAEERLFGGEQAQWLARLDAERENLLAGHARAAIAADGAALGLRLASALKFYWMNRGLLALGRALIVEALARPAAAARNAARARALFDAGQIGTWMGDYAGGMSRLAESLAISRELGDGARIAAALSPLSFAAVGVGDMDAALGYAREAVERATIDGDRHQLAAAKNALAQAYRASARLADAAPLYDEVLVLARETGDPESIAVAQLNRAMVAVDRGAAPPARAMLAEVVDIARASGSMPVALSLLDVATALAAAEGRHDVAALLHGCAEAQAARTGIRRDPTDDAFLRPWLDRSRRVDAAAFAAAQGTGAAMPHEDALARVDAWLGADPAAARAPLSD